MKATVHLALDLGAETGRAIAGVFQPTVDGGAPVLRIEEVHRFAHLPVRLPSGLHWDLTGIWREVLEGVRRGVRFAAERHDTTPASAGVDTWGVDYGLLGASGELIGLPHAYRDERNEAAYRAVLDDVGREAIYDATGIQFMNLNTLFQLAAHKRAEPSMLEQADRLAMLPDLFHYFLTGVRTNEATIASTSQMVDAASGDWARPLLERVGIPTSILGEIRPAGTDVGAVREEVAREIGASVRVVAPAGHDTACAVAAVPADSKSSWCYLSSGTWSLLGAEIDAPCLTPDARDSSFTNEGGVGGRVRFLKNIIGLWLVQECRRELAKDGPALAYDELTARAEAAEPFRTTVDTDHPPFATPGDMPEKIAEYARRTGQPQPTDIGSTIRCCLESLALTYRRTLADLERILDRRFDVLHVIGGGGKNRLLNQMTADATGRHVVVGPSEASAMGNILVQAIGGGLVRDLEHARAIVAASVETRSYEPRDPEPWNRAMERFES